MDKELLRIVIVIIGLIVIAGMLFWGFVIDKKSRGKSGVLNKKELLDRIDPSLVMHTEDDDFDVIPLGTSTDSGHVEENEQSSSPDSEEELPHNDVVSANNSESEETYQSMAEAREQLPELIQYGIVSGDDGGFKGLDLMAAFRSVGLIYGDMQIYERIDENKQINFAVASMVEPGIFPNRDLQSFSCPGIVFFMQPRLVQDPVAAYDDLIGVIQQLSRDLHGNVWDSQRQALTTSTIAETRRKMFV